MRLAVFALAFLAVTVRADEAPALADLAKAKAAHTKEMARLRTDLMAVIDSAIREKDEKGGKINYLLKERKGFAENGVPPILPSLLPASREYVAEKRAADAELQKAYAAAIDGLKKSDNPKDAAALQKELDGKFGAKKVDPVPALPERKMGAKVETKEELQNFLNESIWIWAKGGDLHFKKDGHIGHAGWEAAGFLMRWEVIDRRTVILEIERGRDHDLHAILTFSENLEEFTGFDFQGKIRMEPNKRKR